jgi:phosphatidylserine/phosphatidylglycerophosphate/cardiolipin synthase-like enzyme
MRLALALVFLTALPAHARTHHRQDPLNEINALLAEQALAAKIKPPEDQEVCFSPDEPCDLKLLRFVDTAKESIEVAIYDINLDLFTDKLLEKAKKIPVRIVVDRRQAKGRTSAVKKLLKAGATLKFGRQRGTGIMHNKFVIVDGKALETGSFNFTHHAARMNSENQVYLFAPAVVERYKKRFERLWGDGESASFE